MEYNFDQIANRKNTNSVKYDEYNCELPMWVADMDFRVAPAIESAIKKQLEIGAIGYSLIPDEFFNSFANFYKKHYGTTFSKNEMVYVSGVVASIDATLKRIGNKGDNVVVLAPIYHTFYHCIENNNRKVIPSNFLVNDGKYQIDFLDLEKKLSLKESSILLLCNPHNPIGKIFSKEELLKISKIADKYGVFVISDEIHGLLTSPNTKYIPYSNVSVNDNYMVCLSNSKAFNIAGLQSAIAVIPNEEKRKLLQDAFYEDDIGEPNFFAVSANIAALNESEKWLEELNEYIYENKKIFFEKVNETPHLKVYWGDATYMMWVEYQNDINSREFVKKLNEEEGLLVSPGIQFGESGEHHFRINLATSRENVLKAIQKLKHFMEGK